MSARHGSPLIGIVDYGIGNRRSVEKAIARAGARPLLTSDRAELSSADGLVLPGVGAFPAAMAALRERGLIELIRERAGAGVPLLGSCLGMQLLFDGSEELGGDEGIGLIPGTVVALEAEGLSIPHIGWNDVHWCREDPLVAGLPEGAAFYHVHSFVPEPAEPDVVIGVGDYGGRFATVVGRGAVVGCQFHPEKSSTHGLALLRNFSAMCAKVTA